MEYINLTGDITLFRNVNLNDRQWIGNRTDLPQIINNGYAINGTITYNVGDWEALKAACAMGLPGLQITLSRDITQGEGTAVVRADTTVEMHFNPISLSTETLFKVVSGKLTVKSTQPDNHRYVDRNPKIDQDDQDGTAAFIK